MTIPKTLLEIGAVAAVAATVAGTYVATALAGLKTPFPVSINTTNRTAQGSLGSARNSTDGVQYIFCSLSSTPTTVSATCKAKDSSTNPEISCSSTNANIITAVRSIGSDSLINLTWDSQNHCTQVQVVAGSYLEPKKP